MEGSLQTCRSSNDTVQSFSAGGEDACLQRKKEWPRLMLCLRSFLHCAQVRSVFSFSAAAAIYSPVFALLPVNPVVTSRPVFQKNCSMSDFRPTLKTFLQQSAFCSSVARAPQVPSQALSGCLGFPQLYHASLSTACALVRLCSGWKLFCVSQILWLICKLFFQINVTMSIFSLKIFTRSLTILPRYLRHKILVSLRFG